MKDVLEELSSLKMTENQVIADSYKVIKKILKSESYKPIKFYYDAKVIESGELKKFFPDAIEIASDDFKQIPGTKYHKGLIGVFEFNQECEELRPPFVVLNGVTSPENIGSIVRTIAGLGFKTLVIDKKTASPFLRRAIRVAMGNIIFLNVIRVENLEDFLKNCPHPVYCTANQSNSINLNDWVPEANSGFMIGSEGHGIDPHLYNFCEGTVRIPILEEVEHLNAGHSCAIVASRYLLNTSK